MNVPGQPEYTLLQESKNNMRINNTVHSQRGNENTSGKDGRTDGWMSWF